MIQFRKYQKGDIWYLVTMEDIRGLGYTPEEPLNKHDIAWTATNENTDILGCGGFRWLWTGVYEIWLHTNSYKIFYDNKIRVIKFIKKQIREINYHRIQATCLCKNKEDRKLIILLGLNYEGTLHKFGPTGEDFIIYAGVK